MVSLVPTAIRTGARIARHLLGRHRLSRTTDAGRQRLPIGLGLFGKSAEHAAEGIMDVIERGRLHGIRDRRGQPGALDQMDAEAAENGATHMSGMLRARGTR